MTALTETTSLLPLHDTENQPANIHEAATRSLSKDADIFTRAGKLTILLAGIFTVMFQFADILRFAPSMRLFELGYCRQCYLKHNQDFIDAGGNVSEHLCKIGEVQEQLSLLKAWLGSTSEGAVGESGPFPRWKLWRLIRFRASVGHTVRYVGWSQRRSICRRSQLDRVCPFECVDSHIL